MKTYAGSNAGSQIEPVLWNARESVWIISPWLGKDYAKRLASLSQKGIEVRIITSYVEYNSDSIETFKASENSNLMLMVLDKDKVAFIHAKIYIIDNKYGFSGSANFTPSGMNFNVENLFITETNEELQKLRNDFMNLWMTLERKSMSNENISTGKLSSGNSHSIRDALPLSITIESFMENPNIKGKELVYHPYYFFEYSFRASVGKSPPVLFEDNGFLVLDALTRDISNDNLLEINDHVIKDYVIKTNEKYRLKIHQPIIRDIREAKELVLEFIIKKNTKQYTQHTTRRSYEKIFVPYGNIIRFIRHGFVQVPVWYIEIVESKRRHYENIVLGANGKKWGEYIYCPECQKKIWFNEAVICERCGTKVCNNCIKKKGFIFKEKLCVPCHSES